MVMSLQWLKIRSMWSISGEMVLVNSSTPLSQIKLVT